VLHVNSEIALPSLSLAKAASKMIFAGDFSTLIPNV